MEADSECGSSFVFRELDVRVASESHQGGSKYRSTGESPRPCNSHPPTRPSSPSPEHPPSAMALIESDIESDYSVPSVDDDNVRLHNAGFMFRC